MQCLHSLLAAEGNLGRKSPWDIQGIENDFD